MTVNYDPENHLGVIFRIHGSVISSVLPWCLFNAVMACVVWFLRSRGVANPTFDGGLGYQYIAVLVSFFVVSNVNTAYSRFWEARGYLGKALFGVTKLGIRVAVFTGMDTSDKAGKWRKIIAVRLSRLLQFTMHVISKDRAAVVNTKTSKRGESDALMNELQTMATEAFGGEELEYDIDVPTLCFALEAAIKRNDEYLEKPLHINEQMDLLGKVNMFLDAYDGLIKNSTTPRPFPAVQMGRTLLLIWILSLPFALGGKTQDDAKSLLELIFLVFLVTYGFVGLMMAEIEMHDPYGDDANDLEVKKYTRIILEDIEMMLGDKANYSIGFSFDKDLDRMSQNAKSAAAAKEYGAVV